MCDIAFGSSFEVQLMMAFVFSVVLVTVFLTYAKWSNSVEEMHDSGFFFDHLYVYAQHETSIKVSW